MAFKSTKYFWEQVWTVTKYYWFMKMGISILLTHYSLYKVAGTSKIDYSGIF